MASVSLAYPVECSRERVKELLLDEAFLDAFVKEQHPTQKMITIDRAGEKSVMSWTIYLEGDLPSLVTRFVGRSADLHLIFDLRESKMDMTATAKRRGTLTCAFSIDVDESSRSTLRFEGHVSVSGPFGGLAENTVRDQIIAPVLREDLVRLLQDWCADERRGET